MLVRDPRGWEIRDLGATNGLWIDLARAWTATLQPGMRIRIGELTLVAESPKFMALRSLVGRLIGWSHRELDDTLQRLRDCATQRTPLIVVGDGDLPRVAEWLHRRTLGDAPFVALSPGDEPLAAIRAAAHGTLSVPMARRTAPGIVDAVQATPPVLRPRLVFGARSAGDAVAVGKLEHRTILVLPRLAERRPELPRLIDEVSATIAQEMRVSNPGLTPRDHERLLALRFSSVTDLDDAIRRVIAIRTWGVTRGAARLDLTHPSLSQWARVRKIVT